MKKLLFSANLRIIYQNIYILIQKKDARWTIEGVWPGGKAAVIVMSIYIAYDQIIVCDFFDSFNYCHNHIK